MFNKIKWGFDRWRVMQHPYEEWYRLKQQIQYRIVDALWYKNPPHLDGFNRISDFELFYDVDGLKEIYNHTISDIKSFQLLNTVINDITNNQEWNYDYKNNKRAPRCFVHHIDDFDYNLCEVKYVYELSRLYQLPIMASKAVANKNDQDAINCFNQIMEWSVQNPFLSTIAWKSGNVVGIRSVNLIITINLLSYFPHVIKLYEDRLSALIEYHYKYLVSHLSLFSSKGNHHIGELAGLISICANYSFDNSEKRLRTYVEELDSEILRLIYQDGFNKEQATRYQASYYNLFVVSWLFAQKRGYDISEDAKDRLKSMCKLLSEWRISEGNYFHVGDNDSAEMIYPYGDKNYNIYDSILNDGVVLFDMEKYDAYHFDLRNYLLLGEVGKKKYKKANNNKVNKSICKVYKDSGYFVIKNDKTAILFDVGSIGLLPTMAHGHSDILAFSLYVDKQPVIVDTGSYQYNIHFKKYRDYFHGVHSHNTISVNGLHQAKIGAGMFWMTNPDVKIVDYDVNGNCPYCMASHNGYVRDNIHVIHSRKVECVNKERKIIVTDSLTGTTNETISSYLHFHPSINVQHHGNRLIIGEIVIENVLFAHGKIVRGDEIKPLGWYSSRYDSIEPTNTFIFETELKEDAEIRTIIMY